MALTATTIRMDSELKKTFDNICGEFGMSINTAFTIFAKAVVRSKSIPFKIELATDDPATTGKIAFDSLRRQAQDNNVEMTMEEINNEIASYRNGE